MLRQNLKMYCYAMLAMSFWGLSFIWVKMAYQYYGPLTTIFLRFVMATAFLLLIGTRSKHREPMRREDIWQFLLLAFFEPFCYFLGESFGMQYVSSTMASIIIATIPLFTPFVAYIILREKISIMNIGGLVISFGGIFMLILGSDHNLKASAGGIGLMFFAVAAAVAYGVMARKLSFKYGSFTIVFWQNVLALFYFTPLFFAFEFREFWAIQVQPQPFLYIALLAFFPSICAFYLWTMVMRELGLARTSAFTNVIPLFTAFFSYLILGEIFPAYKLVGVAVVIIGLFVAQMKGRTARHLYQEKAVEPPVISLY